MLSDIRHGTLRRTNSAELISELGDEEEEEDAESEDRDGVAPRVQVYRGLRIADRPSDQRTTAGRSSADPDGQARRSRPEAVRMRVRHNSDGNYDDVSLMQETILSARGRDDGGEANIYQNLIPRGKLGDTFNNNAKNVNNNNHNSFSCSNRNAVPGKLELFKIEPLNKREADSAGCCASGHVSAAGLPPPVPRKSVRQQLNFSAEPLTNTAGRSNTTTASDSHRLVTGLPLSSSDTSSVDSHNDSGYSTRIAVSEGGPSPALPEEEEEEPLLDPHALYMIPPDLRGSSQAARPPRYRGSSGNSGPSGAGSRVGYCGLVDLGGGVVINPKSSFV